MDMGAERLGGFRQGARRRRQAGGFTLHALALGEGGLGQHLRLHGQGQNHGGSSKKMLRVGMSFVGFS
jgi:hypothetical protein